MLLPSPCTLYHTPGAETEVIHKVALASAVAFTVVPLTTDPQLKVTAFAQLSFAGAGGGVPHDTLRVIHPVAFPQAELVCV
jgi:hypothetical protein